MSSSLCWEPVKAQEYKSFRSALKFFLRAEMGLTAGEDLNLNGGSVQFLLGAKAATDNAELREDLESLVAAIKEHGAVRLWEQN